MGEENPDDVGFGRFLVMFVLQCWGTWVPMTSIGMSTQASQQYPVKLWQVYISGSHNIHAHDAVATMLPVFIYTL